MPDVARHARIFATNPDDDFVTKRMAAVKDIASRLIRKKDVPNIIRTANDLVAAVEAKAPISQTLSDDVAACIAKVAPSFIAQGNALQILACAMLGALQVIENGKPGTQTLNVVDVWAVSIWCGLSYQAARSDLKLEALRIDLIDAARNHTAAAAAAARTRLDVPDLGWTNPDAAEAAKIGAAFQAGAKQTVDALRYNAVLDREEVDYLWWALGNWSEILGRPFSEITRPTTAAIAGGLEAATRLRRMPGESHKHLALKHVMGVQQLSAGDLIDELADDRTRLAVNLAQHEILDACPQVFPVLTLLSSGKPSGLGAKIKRSIGEWTARAFLECSALRVTSNYVTI